MEWWMTVICAAGFGMVADAGAGERAAAIQAAGAAVDTSGAESNRSDADSVKSAGALTIADIGTPGFRMPVYTPRPNVDYKIQVVTPDPNIDYKIRTVWPRATQPQVPRLTQPDSEAPHQWKIPDFRRFPIK